MCWEGDGSNCVVCMHAVHVATIGVGLVGD